MPVPHDFIFFHRFASVWIVPFWWFFRKHPWLDLRCSHCSFQVFFVFYYWDRWNFRLNSSIECFSVGLFAWLKARLKAYFHSVIGSFYPNSVNSLCFSSLFLLDFFLKIVSWLYNVFILVTYSMRLKYIF